MRPPTSLPGVALAMALAGVASGFSSGPPNLKTGAPGEGTCADCHGNLNVGGGRITVTAPAAFVPGQAIDLLLKVSQPGQTRWGFELTVLNASNLPVGSLVVVEPTRTQLSVDGGTGRQYIKHTSLGTNPGTPNESPGWTIRWQSPPSGPGAVTFYIAANAANGNSASTGDFIYTNVVMYGSDQTSVEGPTPFETTWSRLKHLFR